MASRKVEDYAHEHGVSNRKAKKALGRRRLGRGPATMPARGAPVEGTGKPSGK